MLKTMGMFVTLFALFLATPAFAGDHGEGEGHKDCHCLSALTGELELSADQQEAIDALAEAKHTDKEAMHEQAMALKDEMEAQWAAEEVDRDAVMAKAEALMDIKAQMHLRKLQFKLDLLEVLTPEQRAVVKETMAAMMGGEHGGHGGKGYGCKGGHGEGHAEGHGDGHSEHGEGGGEPCKRHAN